MKIKKIITTVVLMTAIFCFGGLASAQSLTIAQLEAEIAQLTIQLQAMQAQQGTTVAWCHSFNNNLGIGNSGNEVQSLQQSLQKEGLLIIGSQSAANAPFYSFGDGTAAAVVQFQKKYGIRASGWVGPVTRQKLNDLYGCKTTSNQSPIINYLQPSSGAIGASVTIVGSGFTSTGNRIVFGNTASENNPSYNLNSYDGRTIVFTIPSTNYIACLYSNPACMIAERLIQPGNYNVSVINSGGTSNQFPFTLTSQTVCNPNWQCGWSPCINGSQRMTPIDSINCGVPQSGQIACPALARICN